LGFFAREGDLNLDIKFLEVRGSEAWVERWESVRLDGGGEGLKNMLWQTNGVMTKLGKVD
jgi:hypothetical protein